MSSFKLDESYVDVAERARDFFERYPEGSLRPLNPDEPFRVIEIGSDTLIVYSAAAFRTPDDTAPGIGVATEKYPGTTPYTKSSEVMNAETSAWGRSMAAVGISSRRIATADEVRPRQAERAPQPARHDQQREHAAAAPPKPGNGNGMITDAAADRLRTIIVGKGRVVAEVLAAAAARGVGDGVLEHLTMAQALTIANGVKALPDPEPPQDDGPDPTDGNAPPDDYEPTAHDLAGDDSREPQEAASAAPAASESPAAPEAAESAADASDDGFAEFDAVLSADAERKRADEFATAEKAGRKATITAGQLTRLGALGASLEAKGVAESEWRGYLFTEEGVRSRTQLTKAAASRMVERMHRWEVDLQTGVRAPGEARTP